MKIEAILFDLGKVIIDFTFDKLEGIRWDKSWIRRYERGEVSTEEFHAHLCQFGNLSMELAKFCETWSSIFLPNLITSETLLAALKQRYPLILVSNTNEAHVRFIREKYRVFDYFDHLVFSNEVGSLKPDREIFEHAIKVAGRPADALFFTDDREENVQAARELGIYAHQFVSEPKLIEALHEAGIEIGDFVHRDSLA